MEEVDVRNRGTPTENTNFDDRSFNSDLTRYEVSNVAHADRPKLESEYSEQPPSPPQAKV